MFKFSPIIKTMVWGSERWLISAVPGSESIVAEGPCKGKSLTEIWPEQFPLLIKFIDARQDLSIQVHPNDELALKRHGCKGKTEMWYVCGAGEGAHLLCGLKEKINPQKYVELVETDRIADVLDDYKVAEGDVFFLPAGRIHAIGGGCRIAEIQQCSDITYRIYDYGRKGLDGKPRQLHTQEAKDAIDYSVQKDYRTHYKAEPNKQVQIASCPFFTTCLLDLDRNFNLPLEGRGDFTILICLEGKGKLKTDEALDICEGEAVLVPAKEKQLQIAPEGSLKLLSVHID